MPAQQTTSSNQTHSTNQAGDSLFFLGQARAGGPRRSLGLLALARQFPKGYS
jgi:hypothetical protein